MNDLPRAGDVSYVEPGSLSPPPDDGWEWAVVEVMGHRRHVGRCREVERFGTKMLRVDIPVAGDPANGWQTHHYAGSALFSYTLTDEASALKANKPVQQPAVYRIGYNRSPVDDFEPDHGYRSYEDDAPEEELNALGVILALQEHFPERFKAGEEITPERIAAMAEDFRAWVDRAIGPEVEAGPGSVTFQAGGEPVLGKGPHD